MRAAVVFATLLLPSVAAAEPLAGAPADENLHGDVAVWDDAPLFAEPSDTATPLALATFPTGTRADHAGGVFAMHVVSATGDFVELEPAALDCGYGILAAKDVANPHVFVHRADLAPVVAKRYDASFPDGTHVTLTPGLPVVPTGAGDDTYAIALWGQPLAIALPKLVLGYSYAPIAAPHDDSKSPPFELAPRATAKLGEQAFVVPDGLSGWFGTRADRHGDSTLLTMQRGCVTFVFAVYSGAVKPTAVFRADAGPIFGTTMGIAGLAGCRERAYLAKGTPLVLASGHHVGNASAEISISYDALTAADVGGSVCVDRPLYFGRGGRAGAQLTNDTQRMLRVCAPAARVTHEHPRPGCEQWDGVGGHGKRPLGP